MPDRPPPSDDFMRRMYDGGKRDGFRVGLAVGATVASFALLAAFLIADLFR